MIKRLICKLLGHENIWYLNPLSIHDKERRAVIFGEVECSRCHDKFGAKYYYSIIKERP